MRKRAREEVETVPAIHMDALQGVAIDEDGEAVAAHLPTLSSVNSTGATKPSFHHYHRHDRMSTWSQTTTGASFLVRHQEDIIFSTESNLRRVACADTLYMDGTFEVCPSIIYQIFTIHIFENGQQFPMVYCLLPGKTREIDNRTFTLLRKHCRMLTLISILNTSCQTLNWH